jgi:hypothetical protein
MDKISNNMTKEDAIAYAHVVLGLAVIAEEHSHPRSFGDQIAILKGYGICGYGYSGMAPTGVSMWTKAIWDLAGKAQ